jgi:hypothetical protein
MSLAYHDALGMVGQGYVYTDKKIPKVEFA